VNQDFVYVYVQNVGFNSLKHIYKLFEGQNNGNGRKLLFDGLKPVGVSKLIECPTAKPYLTSKNNSEMEMRRIRPNISVQSENIKLLGFWKYNFDSQETPRS
jgi:hypothetical protein